MEKIDNTEPVGILNTKESELGPSMRKNCMARIEEEPVSSSSTENKFKKSRSIVINKFICGRGGIQFFLIDIIFVYDLCLFFIMMCFILLFDRERMNRMMHQ